MSQENTINIINLEDHHWPQVKDLMDEVIGSNYYTSDNIRDFQRLSQKEGKSCSFGLIKNEELIGARISFAPGNEWVASMKGRCHPELWETDSSQVGYFKSLIVKEDFQGQGWGPKLSQKSMEVITELGGKAIICHSWKESPNNSSTRYLLKYGFTKLCEIPAFWGQIDYDCVLCQPKSCHCTAIEMIYRL